MVINERYTYAAFNTALDVDTRNHAFTVWGASQRLTSATEPMVRGTRSMGGGMVPLRNARYATPTPAPLSEGDAQWLATPCALAQGVSLVKATDGTPAPAPTPTPTPMGGPGRSAWLLTMNDLDSFADWLTLNTPASR